MNRTEHDTTLRRREGRWTLLTALIQVAPTSIAPLPGQTSIEPPLKTVPAPDPNGSLSTLSPTQEGIEHPTRSTPELPLGTVGVRVTANNVQKLSALGQMANVQSTAYWLSPYVTPRVGRSYEDPKLGSFAVADWFDPSIVDSTVTDAAPDDPASGRELLTDASGHRVVLYYGGDITALSWSYDGHAIVVLGRPELFSRDQARLFVAQFKDA